MLKLRTCAQSHALNTRINFWLEIQTIDLWRWLFWRVRETLVNNPLEFGSSMIGISTHRLVLVTVAKRNLKSNTKGLARSQIVVQLIQVKWRHDLCQPCCRRHLAMGLLPDTLNRGLCMHRECWERFPHHRLQRKPPVSDPGMHHGTCVTHVPWCMSGSQPVVAGKRSRHSRRMRNPQFYVSGKTLITWTVAKLTSHL